MLEGKFGVQISGGHPLINKIQVKQSQADLTESQCCSQEQVYSELVACVDNSGPPLKRARHVIT